MKEQGPGLHESLSYRLSGFKHVFHATTLSCCCTVLTSPTHIHILSAVTYQIKKPVIARCAGRLPVWRVHAEFRILIANLQRHLLKFKCNYRHILREK